MGLLVILKMLK